MIAVPSVLFYVIESTLERWTVTAEASIRQSTCLAGIRFQDRHFERYSSVRWGAPQETSPENQSLLQEQSIATEYSTAPKVLKH